MSQVLTVDVFPESPSRDIIYVKHRTREVLFYTSLGFKTFSASLPAPNKLILDTSVTQLGQPGPFEDINHYSDFSFSGKHINVNSSELGISGIFTEEEELYNGHVSYSRTFDVYPKQKAFIFWSDSKWVLSFSKTSNESDYIAFSDENDNLFEATWSGLTDLSVSIAAQYFVDVPDFYTESDLSWFGYYTFHQLGSVWIDKDNEYEFRETPHGDTFTYKKIAELDGSASNNENKFYILKTFRVKNHCPDPSTLNSNVTINIGELDQEEDLTHDLTSSFPAGSEITIPFCDGTISSAFNILKIDSNEDIDFTSTNLPSLINSSEKIVLSTDPDILLSELDFVTLQNLLPDGFLNFNFISNAFSAGEVVAEMTLDILDQSLFTSTNQNFSDIVSALGTQYKINSPVGPEFNQSLFSSTWQNEKNNILSIKNIGQNTYVWEVNAALNLSSGSVANITLRSIDKLENPTEFQKDNFTPIGQYEVFSININ